MSWVAWGCAWIESHLGLKERKRRKRRAGRPCLRRLCVEQLEPIIVLSSVYITNASANEGGFVTFTASISPAPGGPVGVSYQTHNGTGPFGAVAPGHYTAKSGTLGFGPTSTSFPIAVATSMDGVFEADEFFTVKLTIVSRIGSKKNVSVFRGCRGRPKGSTVTEVRSSAACGEVRFAVALPERQATIQVTRTSASGSDAAQSNGTSAPRRPCGR